MREQREYLCDFGHRWTLFTEVGVPEVATDTFCPHGHEAVTCSRTHPPDVVQVLLRPSQFVSEDQDQTPVPTRYRVVLLNREDKEICESKEEYDWNAATKMIGLFAGKSARQALEWWKKRNP